MSSSYLDLNGPSSVLEEGRRRDLLSQGKTLAFSTLSRKKKISLSSSETCQPPAEIMTTNLNEWRYISTDFLGYLSPFGVETPFFSLGSQENSVGEAPVYLKPEAQIPNLRMFMFTKAVVFWRNQTPQRTSQV